MIGYRFLEMAASKTTAGVIDATTATALWPSMVTSIQTDFATLTNTSERTLTVSGKTITTGSIHSDGDNGAFKLVIQQHPLNSGDTLDARYLRVTSTGTYGMATRTASMDFLVDKKINYAVVGKVEIQLGRNTLVQGPVAMATAGKYPPILTLSDFQHFDPNLKTKIVNFETYLKGTHKENGVTVANHAGYDGRIKDGTDEYNYAYAAGYRDTNGDNYIDEYDLFLAQYDTNGDKAISKAEFTNPSTGQLYDANLFTAIDTAGGPEFVGDTVRAGYNDGKIDNSDAYAKVSGQVSLATTASGWSSNLASSNQVINDMIGGPIVDADPTQNPVQFSVTPSDILDLSPANFNTCCTDYRAMSGTGGGTASKTSTTLTNYTVTSTLANGGTVASRHARRMASTTYRSHLSAAGVQQRHVQKLHHLQKGHQRGFVPATARSRASACPSISVLLREHTT